MHVSLKQIQMLTTFDKYNLLLSLYIYILKYVIKEINLLFSNVYKCFTTSLRGKVQRAKVCPPRRHARAHPLTYLWQWFYLIFIYMSSFIITLLLPI
jgi:hypothetical protein